MLRSLFTATFIVCFVQCYAQDTPIFKDETIQYELANRFQLDEVKLTGCSDSFVVFERGSIIEPPLIVTMAREEHTSHHWRVRVVFDEQQVMAPDSSVSDVTYPVFGIDCSRKNRPGKTNCKVFQSADKQRLYVSMLTGDQYEVTWIFTNRQYRGRVVEKMGF